MHYSFCPKCGHRLESKIVDTIERLVCSTCGFTFYQNSKPTAGALVLYQGKVLLVQRAIEPYKDYWDIPGGFLEPGEHPEAGAIREIEEETGLRVKLVDDLGVFMDTYGSDETHTLNFCYVAEIVSGEPRPASDAGQIGWFELEALPEELAFNWSPDALEKFRQRYQAGRYPHARPSSKRLLFPGVGKAPDSAEIPETPASAKTMLSKGLFNQPIEETSSVDPVASSGDEPTPAQKADKSSQTESGMMQGILHRAIRERVSHAVDTLYVNASHQGPEEGTAENPYRTISKAMERAIAENTIVVAPAIYQENIGLKERVKLVSEITGAAIIHGGADRFSGKPTVMGANDAELVGFTITGGYIGVVCAGTSPIIRHNIIRGNYGDYGLLCTAKSRAVIQNNIILANLGSDVDSLSTGLYVENAEPVLYNNIITGNSVGYVSYHCQPLERYNNFWGNRRNFGHSTRPNRRSLLVNPKFIDPARGDFRLQPDSPCRSAGRDPQGKTVCNIGVFDPNCNDVVELAWDDLPQTAKTALLSFPFIDHIQRKTAEGWVNAFDEQAAQFWAMPGDEILLLGHRLLPGREANRWVSLKSGAVALPVVHFGNIHHAVEIDESVVVSAQREKTGGLQQIKIKVPCNTVSGWVFVEVQGLESNPLYLEIRRP